VIVYPILVTMEAEGVRMTLKSPETDAGEGGDRGCPIGRFIRFRCASKPTTQETSILWNRLTT